MMLVFCHVIACVFYAVSVHSESTAPKSWVNTFDGGYVDDPSTPIFDAYLLALFWSVGLLCGQNTNIQSENMVERQLSIVVYLLSALFFAYIIAVVTDQLRSCAARGLEPWSLARTLVSRSRSHRPAVASRVRQMSTTPRTRPSTT